MKRKPKPPTRVAYCACCDSTYTPTELDNYAGSRDARECPLCYEEHPLVWLDVVPRGGARVVRMARAWVNSGGAREDRPTENALLDAVNAMERKEAKR